jgi:hypothetical protein
MTTTLSSRSLFAFYKEEIKTRAAALKTDRSLVRQMQSLRSKGLGETKEYSDLFGKTNSSSSQSCLFYEREKIRKLYLAYALIRGMDLTRVERNPPPQEFYQATLTSMEKLHLAQSEALSG